MPRGLYFVITDTAPGGAKRRRGNMETVRMTIRREGLRVTLFSGEKVFHRDFLTESQAQDFYAEQKAVLIKAEAQTVEAVS